MLEKYAEQEILNNQEQQAQSNFLAKGIANADVEKIEYGKILEEKYFLA